MSDGAPAAPSAEAVAAIPASAIPPGVDPATYVAEKTGAALAEPTPQTPADRQAAERPAHVPEKFWDAANKRVNTEALLKSYSELEKMKGKPAEAAAETPPAEPPAQPDDKATIEKPEDKKGEETPPAPAPVGDLITQLTAKYTDGTIADADFVAAEAAGIPRAVAETYFAGLKALEASQLIALETAAGGKDVLTAARTWAAEALDQKSLDFYNANVTDPAKAEEAVRWLADKYKAANPSEGKLVTEGAPTGQAAGDVFKSAAEVTTAMQDPKYRTDPAYRQAVAEKLARSRAAGTYASDTQFFRGG